MNTNDNLPPQSHEASERRSNRRSWRATLSDPEMLLALSAVFISLCAMVLSAVQVIIMRDEQQIMREEQHMSVWPRLELIVTTRLTNPDIQSLEDSTVVKVSIILQNKGVGPALVEEARTFTDGRPAAELLAALTQVLPAKSINAGFSRITDRTMLPGDSLNVAVFYAFASERQVRQSLSRISLQICYCSVYKDCWTITKTQLGSGTKAVYRQAGDCRVE